MWSIDERKLGSVGFRGVDSRDSRASLISHGLTSAIQNGVRYEKDRTCLCLSILSKLEAVLLGEFWRAHYGGRAGGRDLQVAL